MDCILDKIFGFLFDKLLVVYAKTETQAKRLAARDGISMAQAENIMKSQLPIDEKAGYADFVINNEGTLAETQNQVQEAWETLTRMRHA